MIFPFCRNRQAPKKNVRFFWQSNFGQTLALKSWKTPGFSRELAPGPELSGAQPETRRAGGLVWPALAAGEGLAISLRVRAQQLCNYCAGTAGSTLAWDSVQPWPGMGTEYHATQQSWHKGAAKRSNATGGKAEFELATACRGPSPLVPHPTALCVLKGPCRGRAATPLRAFTTPRLHHSAPSPLRAFATPRLHHSAPSPLRAFATPRLHHSAPS